MCCDHHAYHVHQTTCWQLLMSQRPLAATLLPHVVVVLCWPPLQPLLLGLPVLRRQASRDRLLFCCLPLDHWQLEPPLLRQVHLPVRLPGRRRLTPHRRSCKPGRHQGQLRVCTDPMQCLPGRRSTRWHHGHPGHHRFEDIDWQRSLPLHQKDATKPSSGRNGSASAIALPNSRWCIANAQGVVIDLAPLHGASRQHILRLR